MAREKKSHRIELTEGKRNIIQQLLQEYQIETAEDIQDALKDLLGGTIKEMMEVEMDDHLGYQKIATLKIQTVVTGTKKNSSTADMAIWKYQSLKIERLFFNLRLFLSAREIS